MAREHAEDPISVAEAAYDLAGDNRAWLTRVLAAAAPSLDQGLGVFSCFFELSPDGGLLFHNSVDLGTGLPLASVFAPVQDRFDPSLVRRLFVYGPPVASLLDLLDWGYLSAAEVELGRAALKHAGCRDMMAVRVYEESRHGGLLIVAPSGRDGRAPAPLVQRWERLSGHLAAGLRLRALFGNGRPETAARALRNAAAMESETGRVSREPPQRAIALWRGLVSGKWSLVDHFDTSGRRYIVARRNDPHVRDPRALTRREQQVAQALSRGRGNKQIAYGLGLAASTVAHHVRRVQRKLGFGSRVELVEFLGQLRVHLIENDSDGSAEG